MTIRSPRAHLVRTVAVAAAVVTLMGIGGRGTPAEQGSSAPATPVAAGAAVIGGVVTTDDSLAQPIRRVLVTLTGGGMASSLQNVTDDGGRFVFEHLPAGRYTITAEKPAFVKTFHGSRRPGRGPAMPIALADGQKLTNLSVKLIRGGVIAGTIVDAQGGPLVSAQVSVLQPVFVSGERRLVDPPGPVQRATTDDRGRYRIFGLPPGEYTVRTGGSSVYTGDIRATTAEEIEQATRELRSPATGASSGSSTTPVERRAPAIQQMSAYFPGVADAADAQFFTLDAGEERAGVNLRTTLARASRVDGMSVGPNGQPLQNVLIGIANASTGSLWSSPGIVRPGPDGRFTLPGMTPARWVLFGRGSETTASDKELPLWAETEFVVGERDVTGIVLQFMPGPTVSGRIAFRGEAAPPDLAKLQMTLVPLPSITGAAIGTPPITPKADGTFRLADLAPGKYRLQMTGGGAWSLRSAVLNDRDVLDAPLEIPPGSNIDNLTITLIDRPSEVTGTLFDQLGRPAPEFAVVVFSTDRTQWTSAPRRLSGVVRLASDGRFSVIGLPPGEYYLAVLTDADPSQLADHSFLEQLASSAIRLTLAEGERKVQDVKMAGGG
jgi:uncharacterized protein (DUF2141 family)